MATFKIRYFVEKPDGRCYWQPANALRRQGWQPRRLPAERQAAILEAERLNGELDAWRSQASSPAPAGILPPRELARTLAALVTRWKASDDWKELAPKTRTTYLYCLEAILAWSGDAPAASLTGELVRKFYKALARKTPGKAHATVRVLRTLLQHGMRLDWIKVNPAARPGLVDTARKGRLWSKAAIAAFVAAADRLGWHSVGTAVLLNEWIGQREGDVIRLSRAQYRDGTIHVRQAKTGAEVALPVGLVPHLVARLEAELQRAAKLKVQPTTLLVCETTAAPWKEYHFRHVVQQIRAAAVATCPELADLWFMHLRHTAITRLAEAGCSNGLIATISGHSQSTVQLMIDRYMIRTAAMARAAFQARLDKERG